MVLHLLGEELEVHFVGEDVGMLRELEGKLVSDHIEAYSSQVADYQCFRKNTLLQLALYREAGHPSCPSRCPTVLLKLSFCLILTSDIKPFIVVKISLKSDQN